MATFQEMQAQLTQAKYRRAVIQHLIEYIDENFRPIAGGESKRKLLTEDKVPVPTDAFESVVSEVLLEVDGDLETEMQQILSSPVATAATPEAPTTGKKSKKSTTKEEVKS